MVSRRTIDIFNHSLSEEQLELLRNCVRKKAVPRENCCHVIPLQRFGYTGAQLFEVRFDRANKSAPYIVKMHDFRSLGREIKRQRAAESYFPDAAGADFVEGSGKSCAIIYRKFTTARGVVQEFKDLYERTYSVTNTRRMCTVLRRLYADTCKIALNSVGWAEVELGTTFAAYLRKCEWPEDRFRAIWPVGQSAGRLFPTKRPHPVVLLRELERTHESIPLSPIHGDLHPNNVLMTKGDQPVLIDYAWYESRGPLLADFALMECSLRFLLFPTNLRWETHHRVSVAMCSEDGPDRVVQMMSTDHPHRERYLVMARLTQMIREQARAACQAPYTFRAYLLAQFFILYGLSGIPTYNTYATLDALREIGWALEKS